MSTQMRKPSVCPKCGAAVHRAHRRPIERVVSLVVPLRRYSCHHCGWSGVRVGIHASRVPLSRQQLAVRVVLIVLALLIIIYVSINLSGLLNRGI